MVQPHQGMDLPIERSINVLKYGKRIKATINNKTACCQNPIRKRAIVPKLIRVAREKLSNNNKYLIPKPIRRAENQLTVKTMYLILSPQKSYPKRVVLLIYSILNQVLIYTFIKYYYGFLNECPAWVALTHRLVAEITKQMTTKQPVVQVMRGELKFPRYNKTVIGNFQSANPMTIMIKILMTPCYPGCILYPSYIIQTRDI